MNLQTVQALEQADLFRLVQGVLFQLFFEFGDTSTIEVEREEGAILIRRATTKLKTLDFLLSLEQRGNDWVELMLWPSREAYNKRINAEYSAIVAFTSFDTHKDITPGWELRETILGVRAGAARRLDLFSGQPVVAGLLMVRAHELVESGEFINRVFRQEINWPF